MDVIQAAQYNRIKSLLQNDMNRLWDELRMDLYDKLGMRLHTQYKLPMETQGHGILDLLENTGVPLADIRKSQLRQIEASIIRLENGVYGICEECGTEIARSRLRVEPYACHCVTCQNRRDAARKRTGPVGV